MMSIRRAGGTAMFELLTAPWPIVLTRFLWRSGEREWINRLETRGLPAFARIT
jgi:hypothetical protein